jgi:AraC-like DNA-binding protein
MRQALTADDQPHLLLRSLSVNYSAGSAEGCHTHSWPQLLYARTGAIRAEIEDTIWIVPPRRALWIPARSPHRLKMLGPVKLRTVYCREPAAACIERVRVFDVSGLLHEVVLRVCDLQWLDERNENDRRLAAILLHEIATAKSTAVQLAMPADARARRLARYFLDTHFEFADMSAAYSAAGLSRRTGERIFRKETGLSPARWRRFARLSTGLEALLENGSIEDAAAAATYRSRAAFSDAFSKSFGFPPSAVR